MKVQSRKRQYRQYRPYHFPGQEIGLPLAAWLNGPPDRDWKSWAVQFVRGPGVGLLLGGNAKQDTKARARVIELLRALQQLARIHNFIFAFPTDRPPKGLLRDLESEEEKANRILRRYLSFPGISANAPYWDGKKRHFMFPRSGAFVWTRGHAKGLPQEHWAITWAIEKLAQQGVLDRLRRCDICQQFFFAKRPDALYCGPKCRARRSESPRYKKWREQYDQNRK